MTVLVGIPLETLQTYLADALAARHALLTGKRYASVSYASGSVTYSQADLARLDAYIAELLQQIGLLMGTLPRRGPVYASF
jgi:hypothetical protein